jgi:hypothetical protein
MDLLALAQRSGIRIAEVGFALVAVAGAILVVGPFTRLARRSTILAGIALAVGGVLVIVAVHWGHFD